MLVAERIVSSLVGLLALLVERHRHTRVAVEEHVVVHGLLNLQCGLLARQSVGIEELVDGLSCHAHGILQAARVVVQDYATRAIRTIYFHKHILLVVPALTIKIEQFQEIGIQVMLPAADESLAGIEANLEMAPGIDRQSMILGIGAFVESDTHQHAHGCALRHTSPVGIALHVVDIGQVGLGESQVGIALLDDLLARGARHGDIGIAGRVESLQDERHVAIFPHEVEIMVGTEEAGLGNPPVFLCVEKRSRLSLGDDIVADSDFLVGLCPVIACGRHAPVATRHRVGCRSDDIVGTCVVRESRQVDIQFVASSPHVGLTLPEIVVGQRCLRHSVELATCDHHHATYHAD